MTRQRGCTAADFPRTVREAFPHCRVQAGLQGLKPAHRAQVRVDRTRDLLGSIDLDACHQAREPNAPRWDYLIGWCNAQTQEEHLYFLEVHQAKPEAVSQVLRKKKWVVQKIRGRAPARKKHFFCWATTRKTTLLKHSAALRKLAQQGIIFVGYRLHIPRGCE